MKLQIYDVIWRKDTKLMAGITLIALSFILGFYSKIIFISKFYDVVFLVTGLSIYAVSWIMLFIGAFLVGWETVKIVQNNIAQGIVRGVYRTCHYTRLLPRKSIDYTRHIHKRFKERHKFPILK